MLHNIKKVNYKADLILRDRSSATICFVYTKTDLFMCFLFYEITDFFIKRKQGHCSLCVWIWDRIHTLIHRPFYSEIFAFSPQNDIVSFWRAFHLWDNSPVWWSPGGIMAIYCWPTAGNMTSGCHLRSSAKYLWQTDKVLASPCSPCPFPCWLVLEAINQNQPHFTLQPTFRVWTDSLVLQVACDGLPRHSVQCASQIRETYTDIRITDFLVIGGTC